MNKKSFLWAIVFSISCLFLLSGWSSAESDLKKAEASPQGVQKGGDKGAVQKKPALSPSRIVEGEIISDLIPRPMKYAVLLPEGYDDTEERYPILLHLYPGPPNSHMAVKRWEASIKKAWAEGRLPKLLLVTPAVDISLYQDAHGRGLKWEQAFVGPLLDHLRKGFRIWQDRPAFYATGISAGGAITLRLGLKYPELFGGIAALVPGNEAAATLKDLKFEDTFWRPQNNYEGVDPEAWAKNHPLNIAAANAERIRSSKMGIYLETGDEDSFMLDRGTEKMHRVLWDNNIPHEYHLRRGVDHHVGTIMPTRWQDAYAFLGAHMRNLPPEQIVLDLKKAVNALKEQAAKGIPNDPKVNELYMTLFGFARQQMELEAKLLNNP